ncbi:MAG: 50S ribosomal protein L13 [Patescibacteria group bacterium]
METNKLKSNKISINQTFYEKGHISNGVKEQTIDATEQKLGRLASKVAIILMGKNVTTFRKNLFPNNKVKIINASKLSITDRKLEELTHTRYSGYPGGMKQKTAKIIKSQKGTEELIRHAVSRMLPKNKHRSSMLKNLSVSE